MYRISITSLRTQAHPVIRSIIPVQVHTIRVVTIALAHLIIPVVRATPVVAVTEMLLFIMARQTPNLPYHETFCDSAGSFCLTLLRLRCALH